MKESEYYKISKENNLPLRCPILNYCSRRACTIYLFSEYSKYYPNLNMIQALQKAGEIPKDFEENQILVQGESPSIIRGSEHYYFSDVCPEVNLFDEMNSMISGEACSKGDYDKYYKGEKNRVLKSQHFSECAEFNKYMFDNDKIGKRIKKTNRRKTIPYKIKALLQKEIKSECPICENQEIGHFEIHHIDENPSNNNFENLLMLCPICHSKITKKEISKDEVIFIKSELSKISAKVEFINVFVEEQKYHWKRDEENNHIFYFNYNEKSVSPHLTLNWGFINHLKRTIILKKIIYSGKYLSSGLSGTAIPTLITSIIKYKIPLTLNEKKHTVTFTEQIQVPENQGFQFQTEFFSKLKEDGYSLSGRFYLDVIFEFSNNQKIEIPRLFFNCKSENEDLKYYGLN